MYTGQLKMTKSEIDNDHLVWHVNHILLQLFRVDAKLNLPLHLLVPPTASGDEDDGAGEGGGEVGRSSKRDEGRRTSRTQRPSLPQGTYCGPASEDKGRQNAQFETSAIQVDVDMAKVCKENKTKLEEAKDEGEESKCDEELAVSKEQEEKERRLDKERADIERELREELEELRRDGGKGVEDRGCGEDKRPTSETGEMGSNKEERQDEEETPQEESQESTEPMDIDTPVKTSMKVEDCEDDEVVELEQARIPTPDIVDLLDSDDDEKQNEASGSLEEEVDRKGEELPIPEAPKLLLRGRKDGPSKQHRPDLVIPEAPRLIPRKGSQAMAKKSTGGSASKSPIATQPGPSGSDIATSTSVGMSSLSAIAFPSLSSPPLLPSLPSPRSPVMLARKHCGPRSGKRRRGSKLSFPRNTDDPSMGSPVEESGINIPTSAEESAHPPDALGQAMAMAGLPGMASSTPSSGVFLDAHSPDMSDFGNIHPTTSSGHSSLSVYRGRVGGRGSRGRSKPTKGVSTNNLIC